MSHTFMNANNLYLSLSALLVVIVSFFILSALIMVTYNNSITKMNNNWKTIDYKDSMVFTLFLLLVGGLFSCTHIRS